MVVIVITIVTTIVIDYISQLSVSIVLLLASHTYYSYY